MPMSIQWMNKVSTGISEGICGAFRMLNALYGIVVGVLESCHLIRSEDFAIPQSPVVYVVLTFSTFHRINRFLSCYYMLLRLYLGKKNSSLFVTNPTRATSKLRSY